MCGVGNLTDKPYIYFARPQKGYLDYTTCVAECPSDYNSTLKPEFIILKTARSNRNLDF